MIPSNHEIAMPHPPPRPSLKPVQIYPLRSSGFVSYNGSVNKKAFAKFLSLACGLLILGAAGGWLIHKQLTPRSFASADMDPIRLQKGYEFINPLLLCGESENKQFFEFEPLQKTVQSFVNKKLNERAAEKISVYYRDMPTGRWFGIDENERYVPASLAKVPVMIGLLKLAESDPGVLKQKLKYVGPDQNARERINRSDQIRPNEVHTVNELLEAMIVDSDNNASAMINEFINRPALQEVFTDLGMPVPNFESPRIEFMSAKSYSYFLRILYNSSYLSRKNSEYALELLSKATFEDGLIAGLPKNIPVAHKFGERTIHKDDGKTVDFRELHDCGIIYYPQHPYMLCVMTRGDDFSDLSKVIREISQIVFDENDAEF